MTIELNQFTQGASDNPLVLSDSPAGKPIVCDCPIGFCRKGIAMD